MHRKEGAQKDMVRLGFIGCGTHAAANLYPCLRLAECRLVAACDPLEDRREHCVRAFGAERGYADYRDMLEREPLDAVMVCGPPSLHQAAAWDAIDRGLHVFVEKPPAQDAAGARALSDAARAKGVIGMAAFMKRFAQKYRLAAEISARPEFGGRRHLLLRYSHGARMNRRDTHALITIHAIDLIRHFMGEPGSIQVCHTRLGEGWNLTATFACQRGPATLVSLSGCPGVKERLEITGSGEMVAVDEVATLWHFAAQGNVWSPPSATLWQNNFALQTAENSSAEIQGYAGEVRAFVDAVRSGVAPAEATLDDAARAMEIIEAIAGVEWGVVDVGARG